MTMPLGVTAVMLPELDFSQQLALCSKLEVTHYSFRPRVIPQDRRDKPWGFWGNHKFDLTPRRMLDEAKTIRKQTEDAGLVPFSTNPNQNTDIADDFHRLNFEGAAAVGAPRVRVGPRSYPDKPFDYTAELGHVVDRYGQLVEMAKSFGVKIVIETHSRSLVTAPALSMNVCRHFDPADFGVIFDIPNFGIEGKIVPHLAVSVLDQYIDHAHVGGARLLAGEVDENGFRQPGREMCPLDEADLHIPSWIAALRDAGKDIPLVIEDFSAGTGAENLTRSAGQLKVILRSLGVSAG